MNALKYAVAATVLVAAGWAIHAGAQQSGEKKMENRVFELRIYYASPGKMNDLHARFKDHTVKLLQKHGMELIGFWTDAKESDKKLVYLVAHKSKAAADASWKAFGADPEWKAAKAKSEAAGKVVDKVETTWLNPTEYSAMK
jgi:hypothetical protein